MGSSKIDRESEKIVFKQMVAKALNTLRTDLTEHFGWTEFICETPTIPAGKRKAIVSKLRKYGIIIKIGWGNRGDKFWFKNAKVPVSLVDLETPIEEALNRYYSTMENMYKKRKEERERKNSNKEIVEKKEDSLIEKLSEEECIKYLLSTGKYKIYQSHTEWIEIK